MTPMPQFSIWNSLFKKTLAQKAIVSGARRHLLARATVHISANDEMAAAIRELINLGDGVPLQVALRNTCQTLAEATFIVYPNGGPVDVEDHTTQFDQYQNAYHVVPTSLEQVVREKLAGLAQESPQSCKDANRAASTSWIQSIAGVQSQPLKKSKHRRRANKKHSQTQPELGGFNQDVGRVVSLQRLDESIVYIGKKENWTIPTSNLSRRRQSAECMPPAFVDDSIIHAGKKPAKSIAPSPISVRGIDSGPNRSGSSTECLGLMPLNNGGTSMKPIPVMTLPPPLIKHFAGDQASGSQKAPQIPPQLPNPPNAVSKLSGECMELNDDDTSTRDPAILSLGRTSLSTTPVEGANSRYEFSNPTARSRQETVKWRCEGTRPDKPVTAHYPLAELDLNGTKRQMREAYQFAYDTPCSLYRQSRYAATYKPGGYLPVKPDAAKMSFEEMTGLCLSEMSRAEVREKSSRSSRCEAGTLNARDEAGGTEAIDGPADVEDALGRHSKAANGFSITVGLCNFPALDHHGEEALDEQDVGDGKIESAFEADEQPQADIMITELEENLQNLAPCLGHDHIGHKDVGNTSSDPQERLGKQECLNGFNSRDDFHNGAPDDITEEYDAEDNTSDALAPTIDQIQPEHGAQAERIVDENVDLIAAEASKEDRSTPRLDLPNSADEPDEPDKELNTSSDGDGEVISLDQVSSKPFSVGDVTLSAVFNLPELPVTLINEYIQLYMPLRQQMRTGDPDTAIQEEIQIRAQVLSRLNERHDCLPFWLTEVVFTLGKLKADLEKSDPDEAPMDRSFRVQQMVRKMLLMRWLREHPWQHPIGVHVTAHERRIPMIQRTDWSDFHHNNAWGDIMRQSSTTSPEASLFLIIALGTKNLKLNCQAFRSTDIRKKVITGSAYKLIDTVQFDEFKPLTKILEAMQDATTLPSSTLSNLKGHVRVVYPPLGSWQHDRYTDDIMEESADSAINDLSEVKFVGNVRPAVIEEGESFFLLTPQCRELFDVDLSEDDVSTPAPPSRAEASIPLKPSPLRNEVVFVDCGDNAIEDIPSEDSLLELFESESAMFEDIEDATHLRCKDVIDAIDEVMEAPVLESDSSESGSDEDPITPVLQDFQTDLGVEKIVRGFDDGAMGLAYPSINLCFLVFAEAYEKDLSSMQPAEAGLRATRDHLLFPDAAKTPDFSVATVAKSSMLESEEAQIEMAVENVLKEADAANFPPALTVSRPSQIDHAEWHPMQGSKSVNASFSQAQIKGHISAAIHVPLEKRATAKKETISYQPTFSTKSNAAAPSIIVKTPPLVSNGATATNFPPPSSPPKLATKQIVEPTLALIDTSNEKLIARIRAAQATAVTFRGLSDAEQHWHDQMIIFVLFMMAIVGLWQIMP